MTKKTAISPTRQENYSEWYQEVIKAADLAEHAPVRGCMVIKPYGYALWEQIQQDLDKRFKETGHENAYFPLFIPKSFLEKEAEHVEGFAKECAVVTHHRLEPGPDGTLIPAGELEEPLIVRPTSETIIGAMFAKWCESYRDLPILINQWANVVRWELRTRLFLRTTEFLWQEGHTAHASQEEAMKETEQMLHVYESFVQDMLAIPVITGEKTVGERFAGAEHTYTIEAMMQDGKALQTGTSHFLGQNFAKAQNIMFVDQNEQKQYAYTTSWGVSTRLIGGLIMTHSDDNGLVIPPKIAPIHIVIIPIIKSQEDADRIYAYCQNCADTLRHTMYHEQPLRVHIDKKEDSAGNKSWKYIKKGVPIRIEIGPRDIEQGTIMVGRRDKESQEKQAMTLDDLTNTVTTTLDDMQQTIFSRALAYQKAQTTHVSSKEAFVEYFQDESNAGFVLCYAADTQEYEALLKELKVSPRCIPLHQTETGSCIFTKQSGCNMILFARSY